MRGQMNGGNCTKYCAYLKKISTIRLLAECIWWNIWMWTMDHEQWWCPQQKIIKCVKSSYCLYKNFVVVIANNKVHKSTLNCLIFLIACILGWMETWKIVEKNGTSWVAINFHWNKCVMGSNWEWHFSIDLTKLCR